MALSYLEGIVSRKVPLHSEEKSTFLQFLRLINGSLFSLQPLLLPILMQHCQSVLSLLIPLTVKCNYQLYHKASGTFIHCTPSLTPDHISHCLACSDNAVQRKKCLHRLPANLGHLSGAWNLFWGPKMVSIGKHKNKKQKEIF